MKKGIVDVNKVRILVIVDTFVSIVIGVFIGKFI